MESFLPAATAAAPVWLCTIVSLAGTWAGVRLGVAVALRPLKGAATLCWTERARLAFPARLVAMQSAMLLPLVVALGATSWAAEASSARARVLAVFAGLAALAATAIENYGLARRLHFGALLFGAWVRGLLTHATVVMPHLVIAVVLALVLPDQLDSRAIALLGLGWLAVVAVAAGGGLSMASRFGLARRAAPQLEARLRAAAKPFGRPPRRVYELDSFSANALVFPWTADLAFTRTARAALTDGEFVALALHELAHLCEPRPIRWARMLGVAALPAVASVRPVAGSLGWGAGLALIGLGVTATAAHALLSRRMEERADRLAREYDSEPGRYARALEKVHEVNLIPAVSPARRGVHPHLYDRLLAAGETPAYPRPAPPSQARAQAALLVALVVAVGPLLAFRAAGIAMPDGVMASIPPREAFVFESAMPALESGTAAPNAATP